jgi:hypothetical protein
LAACNGVDAGATTQRRDRGSGCRRSTAEVITPVISARPGLSPSPSE